MNPRIRLDLYEHQETQGEKAAYLLSLDGDVIRANWIPKSLCKKIADGKFEIDAWKARQAGFLTPRGPGQGRLDF